MSRLNKYNFAVLAVIALFVMLPFFTACSNNGPINPDYTDVDGLADIPPPSDDDTLAPEEDPADDTETITDIIAQDPDEEELQTESAKQFLQVLNDLRESDGGVQSFELEADELAVHVWDRTTGDELGGEIVIACEGGPTSLIGIYGITVFENCVFPLTATVKVDGYALETIVATEANVLSFGMTPLNSKQPAWIFGVADSYDSNNLAIYDDNLVTGVYEEEPSPINPDFFQFEIEVPAYEQTGFSAFFNGKLEVGDTFPDPPYQFSPLFFMAHHYAWGFEPLKPGDHRFYSAYLQSKDVPDNFETSDVQIPVELIDILNDVSKKNNRAFVLPTAIRVSDNQYLAMGPHAEFIGTDPQKLAANWYYWDTDEDYDRAVLAGQLRMEDGSVNIVHMDWHPGGEAPDVVFSGSASLGVASELVGEFTFPIFNLTDPIGEATDIIKVSASHDTENTVWNITSASGVDEIDTTDFSIPGSWLFFQGSLAGVSYRAEYTNALSLDINDYTNHQIVMTRRETCYSPWAFPLL